MTSAMRLKAILCFSLILVGVVSSTPEEFEGSGGQEFPGEFPDDEDLSNEESGSGVVDEIITSEPDVGQDSTSLAPVAPKRLSPDEFAEVSVPGPANNGDDKFPEDVEDPDTQHLETHGVPLDAAGFFKGTHFLAAVVIGGCVGLLFAVAVIFLLLYRMRKKDEGSYALDEQKKPANANAYQYTQGQEYYA